MIPGLRGGGSITRHHPATVTILVLLVALVAGCAPRREGSDLLNRALSERARSRPATGSETRPEAIGSTRVETLVPPSALRGADGLACHAGRAFVSEEFVDRIREVRADGSLATVAMPRTVEGPAHLAFDESGNLFVAARRSGSVWRRSPGGNWKELARDLYGLSGLSVSAGRVWLSHCGVEDAISVLDPGATPRRVAENLGCPTGLLAEGNVLYVPLVESGEVLRIETASGARSRVASGLEVPVAVRRGPAGALLVLEARSGRVREINGQSDAGPGIPRTRLAPGVSDLATCSDSVLTVNSIWASVDAQKPWPSAPRSLVAGGLVLPQGAALFGNTLLLSDGRSIKRLRGETLELLAAWRLTEGLPRPSGLTIGGDGAAYISVPEEGRIFRLDIPSGSAAEFSSALRWPTSLDRLWSGELAVAETGTGQVLKIGPGGEWWPMAYSLLSPVALVTDGARLLVSEPAGGRVLSLREERMPLSIVSGLAQPSGLAVGPRHRIFIAERGTGELAVRNTDGSRRTLVRDLALGGARGEFPLEIPLVTRPDGSILLAAPGDGSVLEIRP